MHALTIAACFVTGDMLTFLANLYNITTTYCMCVTSPSDNAEPGIPHTSAWWSLVSVCMHLASITKCHSYHNYRNQ